MTPRTLCFYHGLSAKGKKECVKNERGVEINCSCKSRSWLIALFGSEGVPLGGELRVDRGDGDGAAGEFVDDVLRKVDALARNPHRPGIVEHRQTHHHALLVGDHGRAVNDLRQEMIDAIDMLRDEIAARKVRSAGSPKHVDQEPLAADRAVHRVAFVVVGPIVAKEGVAVPKRAIAGRNLEPGIDRETKLVVAGSIAPGLKPFFDKPGREPLAQKIFFLSGDPEALSRL